MIVPGRAGAEYLNKSFSRYTAEQSPRTRRRAALLATGEKLFAEQGYRSVSVEQIAHAAGLATGSFYNYFPSKEAFYGHILEVIERRAVSEARRVVSRFESPMNQLKALYRFITLGLRRSPILRGMLTGDRRFVCPGDGSEQRSEWMLRHIGDMIDDILLAGARRRTFRIARFHNARRMLIALYTSLLADFGSPGNDELIEDTLTLVERGLRRRLTLRNRAERVDRRRARGRGRTPADD
jgi:AcrR family transcriptional regulator